jgi:hypothetical protein
MQGGMQAKGQRRDGQEFDEDAVDRSTDEFPNYMKQKYLRSKRKQSLRIAIALSADRKSAVAPLHLPIWN